MRNAPNHDTQLRTRRIPYPKRVTIDPRDGTVVSHETVIDLSLGGMFVSTYLPLEVGKVVDFEIEIAQIRFKGSGRVVWTRSNVAVEGQPAGVAVEFLNLTPGQKRLLYREITDFVKSGGRLKVGKPPRRKIADRRSTAREGKAPPAAGGGLLRRFTSMLGL
jgi:Tfp pilus assembly protein PilZ